VLTVLQICRIPTHTISPYQVSFQDTVDCPKGEGGDDNAVCSGQGECNRELGRCLCNPGKTLDDCSADGPFFVPANSQALDTPPIAPDDWVFFTVAVGYALYSAVSL
jgi:hypothetical protein